MANISCASSMCLVMFEALLSSIAFSLHYMKLNWDYYTNFIDGEIESLKSGSINKC